MYEINLMDQPADKIIDPQTIQSTDQSKPQPEWYKNFLTGTKKSWEHDLCTWAELGVLIWKRAGQICGMPTTRRKKSICQMTPRLGIDALSKARRNIQNKADQITKEYLKVCR
jgi:hypothetical protein